MTGKKEYRRGSGTLEILIAFAVLTLAITAGISLAFGNQGLTLDTELDHQAFYKAVRELDGVRAGAVGDFDSVSSSLASVLAAGEGLYNNIYTRQIDVLDISPCAKQVTSRITWQIEALRPQEVEFATLLTSTSSLAAMGGDCSASPPRDEWQNPASNGSIDFNPSGNQATDVDVVKQGGQRIAFVTSKTGSAEKDDLWAVNVDNPAAPVIAGQLHTGPGLNALDVADGWAFAANDATTNQLHVIDVSNPAAPVLAASSSMPAATTTAISIRWHDSRVYVGTQSNDGHEFFVFDVDDPQDPQFLGSINLNRDVNAIAVRDGVAYLATSADAAELTVLDVSDPGDMGEIGLFDAVGDKDGTSLHLLSNRLYLGRERAASGEKDFYILNVGDPEAPAELGSKYLDLNPNTEVSGIIVAGRFAFLATTDQTGGFQVWNIQDPANIIAPSACNLYNYSEKATGMDYMDDRVYVSNESNNALRIIWDDPSATCP